MSPILKCSGIIVFVIFTHWLIFKSHQLQEDSVYHTDNKRTLTQWKEESKWKRLHLLKWAKRKWAVRTPKQHSDRHNMTHHLFFQKVNRVWWWCLIGGLICITSVRILPCLSCVELGCKMTLIDPRYTLIAISVQETTFSELFVCSQLLLCRRQGFNRDYFPRHSWLFHGTHDYSSV